MTLRTISQVKTQLFYDYEHLGNEVETLLLLNGIGAFIIKIQYLYNLIKHHLLELIDAYFFYSLNICP